MRMTGSLDEPELAFLPWGVPLEDWPEDLVVALPRGISRHIVRFVRMNGVVYAVKEVEEHYAKREYELLFDLVRRGLPTVEPVGVVLDRTDADGEELPAGLITRHLEFSLPYRALFSSSLRLETANRLLDALAVLLVQLHLSGFSWNDCSLSNTLFRRDAGAFAAYLVDAETGELHPSLSNGQRMYDLETAATNVAGELMDLQAGGRLHEGIDPIVTGVASARKVQLVKDLGAVAAALAGSLLGQRLADLDRRLEYPASREDRHAPQHIKIADVSGHCADLREQEQPDPVHP